MGFRRRNWRTGTDRLLYLNSLMSAEEQELFFIDVAKVDLAAMAQHLAYGLRKYVLGEDVPAWELGWTQIVRKNQLPWAHSLAYAARPTPKLASKSLGRLMRQAVDEAKFQVFLKKVGLGSYENPATKVRPSKGPSPEVIRLDQQAALR